VRVSLGKVLEAAGEEGDGGRVLLYELAEQNDGELVLVVELVRVLGAVVVYDNVEFV
jgi:hypothetical protein